jgi:arginase
MLFCFDRISSRMGLLNEIKKKNSVKYMKDLTVGVPPPKEGSQDREETFIFAKNIHQLVFERVTAIKKLKDNKAVCLVVGGDHAISIGTISGHLDADPEIAVLYVDAHADINTFETSPSKNVHGMDVMFQIPNIKAPKPLTRLDRLPWLTPKLKPSRLAYIGLRSVDDLEWPIIHENNITYFTNESVHSLGIDTVIEKALYAIDPYQNRSLHLNFDIDAVDPKFAPATGTPVVGGLSISEGMAIASALHKTGRLQLLEMVEVNPSLAKTTKEREDTVHAALQIVLAGMNGSGPEQ